MKNEKPVVILLAEDNKSLLKELLLNDIKVVVVTDTQPPSLNDLLTAVKEAGKVSKEQEKRKIDLGRIPTPPPGKVHSSKKGGKGYNRKQEKARQRKYQ